MNPDSALSGQAPVPSQISDPNGLNHPITRRAAISAALAAAGGAAAFMHGMELASAAEHSRADTRRAAPKRYEMKKSINLWAFPYPDRMNLRDCLELAKRAGFDGIELNYDLEND